MTFAVDPPERRNREPGRLSKAVTRLWMKAATVAANEKLADRFHLITLEGPALEDVKWLPGQKVQIAMGSAFVTRTYTPIEWNPAAGRVCILGYAHGDGPGSAWVTSVAPGDACDVFGPRASLDLSRLSGPLVMVGDETVIGLAVAVARHHPARRSMPCFEVEDAATVRHVTKHLGLEDAVLVERLAGDAHVATLEAALIDRAAAGACFVLAGKAGTIQRLRQTLKQQSVPAMRVATKAYWAPGKRGLD